MGTFAEEQEAAAAYEAARQAADSNQLEKHLRERAIRQRGRFQDLPASSPPDATKAPVPRDDPDYRSAAKAPTATATPAAATTATAARKSRSSGKFNDWREPRFDKRNITDDASEAPRRRKDPDYRASSGSEGRPESIQSSTMTDLEQFVDKMQRIAEARGSLPLSQTIDWIAAASEDVDEFKQKWADAQRGVFPAAQYHPMFRGATTAAPPAGASPMPLAVATTAAQSDGAPMAPLSPPTPADPHGHLPLQNPASHLRLLEHASACTCTTCGRRCANMKALLKHPGRCRMAAPGRLLADDCRICKHYKALLQLYEDSL